MKLRMDGRSVRLRLKQGEVGRLVEVGRLEETLRFGEGPAFTFALQVDEAAARLAVRHEAGRLTVVVPADQARAWAAGDAVSLEGVSGAVALLVEKDFQCLHREASAEDADTFPHPRAGEAG